MAIPLPVSVGKTETDLLSSETFDLADSGGGSSRLSGVFADVISAMCEHGLTFDEGRFELVQCQMAKMGVDATGMPADPRVFTFGRPTAAESLGPSSQRVKSTSSFAGLKTLLLHTSLLMAVALFFAISRLGSRDLLPTNLMCQSSHSEDTWMGWACGSFGQMVPLLTEEIDAATPPPAEQFQV